MSKHNKARIRIKLNKGQWYAFGGGPKRQRNLMLVSAISFCKRLNSKKGGAL